MFWAWREHLRAALQTIRTHKLRAGLTMLGVVIGVTSVILVAAIIHGLNQHIADKVQEIGAKVFFVSRFPAFGRIDRWTEEIRKRKHLTYADAVAIREQCPSVEISTPAFTRAIFFGHLTEVRYRNRVVENPFIRGAEPEFAQAIPALGIKEGRMYTHAENDHAERVAVLGLAIADGLFGPEDPVEKTVRLNGHEFRVVGVLERHQGLFGTPGADQFILIPHKTFAKLWPEIEEVILVVAVADPRELDRAKEQVISLLRRRRGVPARAENDFELSTPDLVADLWEELTGAVVILTFIIASIALVVGGIGVMNIMLVSVTERTGEIGLRKAVGARRGDIRQQFLTEAVALTAIGGLVGVVLGATLSQLIGWLFPSLPATVSLFWVMVGLLMAVAVGLFFGIYPAYRAAGLDPVACLRYE
jgi:putative ABC transport system permease protein